MSVYTYTTLDDPLATGGTFAFGINATGQVVGYYQNASGSHGFLYAGGTYTTLDYPSSNGTLAYGINDSGQIIGFYSNGTGEHGFLYLGGSYTSFDDPSATNGTDARGINDLGQIVGGYVSGSGDHGYAYISNLGLYITLDDPWPSSIPLRMGSAMPA